MEFVIDETGQDYGYFVFRTLKINLPGRNEYSVRDYEVIKTDSSGEEVVRQISEGEGSFTVDLPELTANGPFRTYFSACMVNSGKKKIEVILNQNLEIDLSMK